MKHLCEDFGCTDHWYEADGYFTAGRPPWLAAALSTNSITTSGDSSATTAAADPKQAAKLHAEHAYMAINHTDPKAVWLYQGWILPGAAPFTEGLVAAVEPGRLVISDMRCEDANGCEWSDDYSHGGSFYGAPFIFGTLHNFGGTLGMWGSLPQLTSAPLKALCNATSMSGIGMLPEGIDQNTPWSTFLMDTNWATVGGHVGAPDQKLRCDVSADRQALIDIPLWVSAWAMQRYGGGAGYDEAHQAWSLIINTVYGKIQGKHTDAQDQADALTSYPVGAQQEGVEPRAEWYDLSKIYDAWGLLVEVADKRATESSVHATAVPNSLRYDVVNTGREVLAKLSNRLFNTTTAARSVSELAAAMGPMLEALADADELVSVYY